MGLDSAWVKMCNPGETAPEVKFDPPLDLIGGIFSGHGEGSFRGKCYAERIEEITGVSLYQEVIMNYKIKQMADKLDEWGKTSNLNPEEPADGDAFDLVRMFRAYADAGFALCGWW